VSGVPHASLFAIAFLTLLGCSSPCLAQLVVDNWTTENGLPQNSVNDILQTRDRYMWFATHGGLVRFDGMRFVVFDRSVEGIGSQRLMALHEDWEGTLWAASDNGMLIRYRDGRFTTYANGEHPAFRNVARIEEDEHGDIWITSYGRITRFDGERFDVYAPERFDGQITAPPPARYLETWWGADPVGLRAFVRGRVRTYPVRRLLGRGSIRQVLHDRQGNLWISTGDRGVIRASGEVLERYPLREGASRDDARSWFTQGRDGTVWYTDFRTLHRIRNGRHEQMDVPPQVASQLRSFYVDDEGSTWFGTTTSGVFRVHDPLITVHREHDGVSLRFAYAILQDRRGAIWISTNGLQKYADGRVTDYGPRPGRDSDIVTCLYEDRAGRLWVGTNVGVKLLSENGRLSQYDDRSGLLRGAISSILEGRDGTFWFATTAGLVRSGGTEFRRFTTADGLSRDQVTALFEDRTGVLWIGTALGFTRFDGVAFTAFTEREGFVGYNVRAFHEDADGHLWIGTYDGGLYRLASGRLTRYTRADGLHDNGVFQILEDDDGYFWMGSNRGIQRISRRELNEFADGHRESVTAVAFDHRDGLASVEVNGGRAPAGLKTPDGKLWFPTMGGVAVIDPLFFRTSGRAPAAIVEEFRVDGKPVALDRLLQIDAQALTFDVRYTAPSFVRPAQVSFQYRLSGFDDDWVDAGHRREASFYGIPPGRYTFEVVAADRDGIWSTSPASLQIIVLPPFWRTWWFICLILAAAVTLTAGGHAHRVRRLQTRYALQEEFSQRLIDAQERERRRVSNEMHDSLGQQVALIKQTARSGLAVAAGRPTVEAAFDEIAALAEAVNSEMTEIAYALRPHQLDTIGLSRTIETMVTKVGRAWGVQLEADIAPIDDRFPEGSHIHIFRIVQEAVTNIVKHSQATSGRVAISRNGRSVEIVVRDNGIGFGPNELEHSRSTSHGAGLVGIRERARILGGRVEIRSGAPSGTTITVTLLLDGGTHG
jgi:signal transduction histidine kinase/ligand-binding sensor domain-containing protein